jgi:hypothetical protein
MKTAFRNLGITFAVLILACMALGNANAATTYQIYAARVISAGSLPACTVTGRTAATPSVTTCSRSSPGSSNGDQAEVPGIGGTTPENVLAYVGGVSASIFALCSDSAFTTGITGTGAYGTPSKTSPLSQCPNSEFVDGKTV